MAGYGASYMVLPTVPSLPSRTVPTSVTVGGSSATFNLGDNEKRWLVIGISLNKVLLPRLRQFIDPEIQKHYTHHKTSFHIDNQKLPHILYQDNATGFKFSYESVNNNITNHKSKKKSYNYNVTSAVDFAKLYLQPAMAKLAGFDDTCDMSAALGILAAASVFSLPIQTSAKAVRQDVRNEWGHCNFLDWDGLKFARCFQLMETLVKNLNIPHADEKTLIDDLKDWEMKGIQLCMGNLLDADLMKLVTIEVEALSKEVEQMGESADEDACRVDAEIQKIRQTIDEQKQRIDKVSDSVSSLGDKVEAVHSEQDEIRNELSEFKEVQESEGSKLSSRLDVLEDKHENLEKKVDDLERERRKEADSSTARKFQAPNRVRYFCGRVKELDFLATPLENQEPPCVFSVICGLGGTGKTSLVLEHVWINKEKYNGGVYWISGESSQQFQITLKKMARELDTQAEDLSQTLSDTLSWLETCNQYWCLVIDNLDELELSDDMMELLNGIWKRNATGHVIITTRREKPRLADDIQEMEENRCLELGSLTESDSILFLKRRTNRPQEKTDEEEAIGELAEELGYLPLALDQAGAYISKRKCTFLDYKNEYEKKKLKLLQEKARWIGSAVRARVQTTWQINFDYVVQRSQETGLGRSASLLMEISAFFSPDDIPHEIINEGLPPVSDEGLRESAGRSFGEHDLLTLLTDFSLFQRFTDRSYSVHRVVQEVIRSKIDKDSRVEVLQSATRMLNFAFSKTRSPFEVCKNFQGDAVFIDKNPPSLQLWSKLSAHSFALQEHLMKYTDEHPSSNESLLFTQETVRVLHEASVFLSASREKVKAQELHRRKLELIVKLSNPPVDEELEYLKYFDVPLKQLDYKLISHCMINVERGSEIDSQDNEALKENVDALREKGNAAVKDKDFKTAVEYYSEGILLDETDHRLFSNRALCYLKLSKAAEALEDCEKCLKLQRNNGKALQRKAWALHLLASNNPNDKHLRSRSLAVAALALYIAHDARDSMHFKQMFPNLEYHEIRNPLAMTCFMLLGEPQMTLLLHDGYYELQEAVFTKDAQIVGIGSHVKLKFENECKILNASCCFENLSVVKGSGAILCQVNSSLTLLDCDVSAGLLGCEDFPDCNGGPGCIADRYVGKDPCNRESKFGEPGPSGVVGFPGIQIISGSTGYIKNCDIHDCGGGGAISQGKDSEMTVISCRISNNHQAGLEAREDASLVSIDNDIFANKFHGLLIGPSAKSCNIADNRIFENWKEGIMVGISNDHETSITGNKIYHNHPFGISLEYSSAKITKNNIFENGFFGILAKSRTTAYIAENEIYSNKCGGIEIGINYSGRVVIESNTVRDHSGPWLHASPCDLSEKEIKMMATEPYLLPPGETKVYTTPAIARKNTLNNNQEGMFHPRQRVRSLFHQCAFCHVSGQLKRCANCKIAEYCSQRCQRSHWPKHKILCEAIKGRYAVTLDFKSFDESNMFRIRSFGSHLKGIGTGPKPDPRSSKRFIVKVQTKHLNSHPLQMLTVYDKSLTIDGKVQSPEIFHVIMECGVLGGLNKFTSKKVFLYATFADRSGTKLTFFLDQLATYQEW